MQHWLGFTWSLCYIFFNSGWDPLLLISYLCSTPDFVYYLRFRRTLWYIASGYSISLNLRTIPPSRIYNSMEELVSDYESGALHPGDLKPSLSKALNQILQVTLAPPHIHVPAYYDSSCSVFCQRGRRLCGHDSTLYALFELPAEWDSCWSLLSLPLSFQYLNSNQNIKNWRIDPWIYIYIYIVILRTLVGHFYYTAVVGAPDCHIK